MTPPKSVRVSFHPLNTEFTVRGSLDDMDVRSKLYLFNALADKLGLTAAAQERPNEPYEVLWKEMMERHWK